MGQAEFDCKVAISRLRLGKGFQFLHAEPLGIGVTRIPVAIRWLPATRPAIRVPPRVRGLDDIHVFEFDRIAGFILAQQDLVQFLPWPDPDIFHRAFGSNRPREIHDIHAGDFGDEDLATVHALDAVDDEAHALIQGDPKTGHPPVGDCDFASRALFLEERDHAATTADDVAVTDATKACSSNARVSIALNEQLFGAQLGRAVKISWIDRLVSA